MQNKKKNTAKNILLTGSLIAGSVFGRNSQPDQKTAYHQRFY